MASDAGSSEGLQHWMGFISERIRHFRELAGLTQQEHAEKTGLRQSHISRLEQAHHSPSALTLEKIAGALGIAVSELDPSLS
jgi:transcriptional regulator with XRE-family HTH domain